jgi:MFS family permease
MAERRPDPVLDDGLHVFVPALMGVGMIVSGILVLADWLQNLLPNGRVRRKQFIASGAKGVVVSVAQAAGHDITGPDFHAREWRPRWAYAVWMVVFVAIGAGALLVGLLAFNDDIGLFYRNPWMVGIGVGTAGVFGLLALQLLFFAVVHRRSFQAAHVLVETTWFGRLKMPPADPSEFAASLRLIERKGLQ